LLYFLFKGASDFLGVTVAGSEFCQDATGDFLADNDAFCQTRYTYKSFMDNNLTVCLETVYNKKMYFPGEHEICVWCLLRFYMQQKQASKIGYCNVSRIYWEYSFKLQKSNQSFKIVFICSKMIKPTKFRC